MISYELQQNRPYSVLQLFDNLHATIPRTRMQQMLDRFHADGLIQCKVFGKSQIYFANQVDAAVPQDELDEMDERVETLKKELAEARAANKIVQSGTALCTRSRAFFEPSYLQLFFVLLINTSNRYVLSTMISAEVNTLEAQPTNSNADAEILRFETELAEKRKKLDLLSKGGVAMSSADLALLYNKYKTVLVCTYRFSSCVSLFAYAFCQARQCVPLFR